MHNVDSKMVALRKKFRDFYNKKLVNDYKKLEKKRYKYLVIFILSLIVAITVNYGLFWAIDEEIIPDNDDLITFVISVSIIVVFIPILRFKRATKDAVMKKIISFFGENINYSKNMITDDICRLLQWS